MTTTARHSDVVAGQSQLPQVPGVVGLVAQPDNPRVFLGYMGGLPVRVLVVDGDAVALDPVAGALERLRPATDHPFASRLHGTTRLDPHSIAVVTDHHPMGSVERVVTLSGPATPDEALVLVADVADALACCHRAGFVHGHLGPATIKLGDDRHPRLGSPGALGELESALGVVGAPAGITPPEGYPSAAGDIYALAMTAIYVATGAADVRFMPPGWSLLFGAALSPDPALRPTDAQAFAAMLRSAIGPVAVVDDLQLNKVPRSSRTPGAKVGAGAALVVGGLAVWAVVNGATRDEPRLGPPVTTVADPNPSTTPSIGDAPTVATSPAAVTSSPPPTAISTATSIPPASSAPPIDPTTTAVAAPPPTEATTPTTVRPSTVTTRRRSTTASTTPSSSTPTTVAPSTLPPDVERGRD